MQIIMPAGASPALKRTISEIERIDQWPDQIRPIQLADDTWITVKAWILSGGRYLVRGVRGRRAIYDTTEDLQDLACLVARFQTLTRSRSRRGGNRSGGASHGL
jgi:hypothetical protein